MVVLTFMPQLKPEDYKSGQKVVDFKLFKSSQGAFINQRPLKLMHS